MDGLHEVSEVPEWALEQSKILTVNQEKLRTTGLESDIKQKKSYWRCPYESDRKQCLLFQVQNNKGVVISKQNKKYELIEEVLEGRIVQSLHSLV